LAPSSGCIQLYQRETLGHSQFGREGEETLSCAAMPYMWLLLGKADIECQVMPAPSKYRADRKSGFQADA
jgi:hypothetical protein